MFCEMENNFYLMLCLFLAACFLQSQARSTEEINVKIAHDVSGLRPGSSSNQDRCSSVTGVPFSIRSSFRLSTFYSKYTHAYNIPILGSSRVSDAALRRACYVVRFLLADRQDLRQAMYSRFGRAAIMATTEVTQNIPEHSYLSAFWNTRARGLGGTLGIPLSTGAEENVLCLRNDRYREDIFVHEFAHGILNIALATAVPTYKQRLTAAYNNARRTGLWANTYADDTLNEYFAEGVQSFFNVESPFSPGIHNDIDTREELRSYDPTLFNLLLEAFPCQNQIVDRCQDQRLISSRTIRRDCSATSDGRGTGNSGGSGGAGGQCVDRNGSCPSWASRGECRRNPSYMLTFCQRSCRTC